MRLWICTFIYAHHIQVVEVRGYILKYEKVSTKKQSLALFGVCSRTFKVDRDIIYQSEP